MFLRILCLAALLCLPLAGQAEPLLSLPTASVVKVTARTECASSSQGSGVVVGPGIVITSAHGVQGATEVRIVKDGITYFASAHILAPELDLCLLRVPALSYPAVTFASEASIQTNLRVNTIGFPGGQGPVITKGSITGLWRFRSSSLIQSDATIRSGSSGGGLFTEDGRLAGITTFTVLSYEGLNFCLPVSWIPELLTRPWTPGTTVPSCKTRETLLQEFLDGMTENPNNRVAWESFSRAWVSSRPNDAEAWFSLGHTLFQQIVEAREHQNPDPAILDAAHQAYLKTVELNPSHSRAWNNLGVIQDALGDSTTAIASLRKAVLLQTDYPLAWLNLGSVCVNTHNYSEGARAFQRGLSSLPDEASSWARLALCEEKLGRWDEAIRHLRIALRIRPMHLEWWTDLAQICQRVNRAHEFAATHSYIQKRLPTFAEEISHHVKAYL